MATQKIMEKKQNQYAFASWPKNHRSRPPFRFIFPAHLAMLIDVHLWLTSLIRPLRCQGSGRGIITGHLSSMHFDVYVDPGSTRNKKQPKRYKDTNVRWYGATERIWPKRSGCCKESPMKGLKKGWHQHVWEMACLDLGNKVNWASRLAREQSAVEIQFVCKYTNDGPGRGWSGLVWSAQL